MASSSVSVSERLPARKLISEGSCLLRNDSLPRIDGKGDGVVVFLNYSIDREHNVKGGSDYDDDDSDDEEMDGDGYECSKLRLGDIYHEKMTIKFNNFPRKPGESGEGIRVIEFLGCSTTIAEAFLEAVADEMHGPGHYSTADPAHAILASSNLNIHGNFITGMSLHAAFEPKEFLTLFAAIPYLGLGDQYNTKGSVSLNQYRFLGSKELDVSSDAGAVMVHQAWFFLLDEATIGLFKSANDRLSDRASLFPYQALRGGFHGLIQMISNLFTPSEAVPLKNFREEISKQESMIWNNIRQNNAANNELMLGFDQCITDVSTMGAVVDSQIRILGEISDIYQNSFPKLGISRPHRNAVRIPVIQQATEQIPAALGIISAVVEERKRFRMELKIWLKDLERSRMLFSQSNQTATTGQALEAATTMLQNQRAAAAEALAQAKSMQADQKRVAQEAEAMRMTLKQQGQTISVFTLITAVFLPLGFFAAYFALSFQRTVTSVVEFWIIVGPITAIMSIFMGYFLFGPDDLIKGWLKKTLKLMGIHIKDDPDDDYNHQLPQHTNSG